MKNCDCALYDPWPEYKTPLRFTIIFIVFNKPKWLSSDDCRNQKDFLPRANVHHL